MKLNYQEIMGLPEPRDGADVGTMDSICGVYAQLVVKFTRLLVEARQVKICWMQQERIDLYAKRLAANQREYRCKERQLRQGAMFNFCLRVREWVLTCSKRRLKIRRLIGDARIAKWHARKLAKYAVLVQNPELSQNPVLAQNKEPQFPSPQNYNYKNTSRQEVGNWYRLPYIGKQSPDKYGSGKHGPDTQGPDKQVMVLPTKGGMRRAIPSVVFWPDELALDYVHEKARQTATEKPVRKRPNPVTLKKQYPQENTRMPPSHMGAHTAKEWPD